MLAVSVLPPLAVFLLRLSLCLNWTSPPALAAEAPKVGRRLAAMGTSLEITVAGQERAAALEASEAAVREIARVEAALTTWRSGGAVAALNAAPPGQSVSIDPEVASVLSAAFEWSRRTDGAFDPTVLPLVRAWGLRESGRIPSDEELAKARDATGTGNFRIDAAAGRAERLSASAGIDEGAWGKGYALDRAIAALRAAGVGGATVDLGGQVSAIGPAAIAIADPRDRLRQATVIEVADSSVSTSGNSERGITIGGRRIGHLLDPRTGRPAPDFGSVTVVAPSGFSADVLSTAFFVLGPEKGLELSDRLRRHGIENEALFLIVTAEGLRKVATSGLKHIEEE